MDASYYEYEYPLSDTIATNLHQYIYILYYINACVWPVCVQCHNEYSTAVIEYAAANKYSIVDK